MKSCKKCGNTVPLRTWIEGKLRTNNHRLYCFDCSPFGQHNTRKLEVENGEKSFTCVRCGKLYVYKVASGRSSTICVGCMVTRRRQAIKEQAIELKGGCCEQCGYSKSKRALQFHHRNKEDKTFTISAYSKSWKKVAAELDKCALLCANCHAEQQDKEYEENCGYKERLGYTQRGQSTSREPTVTPYRTKLTAVVKPGRIPKISMAPSEVEALVWQIPTTTLAAQLGVTDSAVGKYCRKHNIAKPERGYWQKRGHYTPRHVTKVDTQ